MSKSELIAKIGMLPDQIAALVDGLNEADLTTPYLKKEDGSAEWTVAQNVHHLADSHANSYIRCMLVMTEDHPTIRPYDQDGWAARPEAKAADLSYSMLILRGVHQRWVKFWESLSEDEWNRTGFHPEGGDFSLADQLLSYVNHGEGHIEQIQRTLAAK